MGSCRKIREDVSCAEAFWFPKEHRGRLLTADFNEALGLITCERALFDQAAKEEISLRSGRV